jgi:hypothetical protein
MKDVVYDVKTRLLVKQAVICRFAEEPLLGKLKFQVASKTAYIATCDVLTGCA